MEEKERVGQFRATAVLIFESKSFTVDVPGDCIPQRCDSREEALDYAQNVAEERDWVVNVYVVTEEKFEVWRPSKVLHS